MSKARSCTYTCKINFPLDLFWIRAHIREWALSPYCEEKEGTALLLVYCCYRPLPISLLFFNCTRFFFCLQNVSRCLKHARLLSLFYIFTCTTLFLVYFYLFGWRKPTHCLHPEDSCYVSCLSSARSLLYIVATVGVRGRENERGLVTSEFLHRRTCFEKSHSLKFVVFPLSSETR